MATYTINPSVDAYITASNANFGTLRTLTAGSSVTDDTTLHIACDKPGSYEIKRDILVFDTSSIPDGDVISSAKFYFYRQDSGDSEGNNTLAIQGATPASEAVIVVGDWDCMTINTPTEYATRLNFSAIGASGYHSFTLNASGIAAINKTGNTVIAVREGTHDIDNSAPAGTGNYLIYTSSSGANPPYLEIVTGADGPANLKTYNTNVKANIKTINTNPLANIKSLNTNT